jgi:outer membrane protein assembly factor BamB
VSCDKGLCVYDTLGRFKWSYAGAGGQIAVANGKVYTGWDVSDVCALNATTGALVWRFDGESQVLSATAAGGIVDVRTPGVVGSIDAASGAFLSDGAPFADGFGPPGTEAPVVVNGRVYRCMPSVPRRCGDLMRSL